MRIVVLGPLYPFRGGIAHFTTRLVDVLSRKHEVLPFTFTRQYPTWLYPGSSDRDNGPGRMKIHAQAMLDPMNPLTWKRTADAIVQARPGLVVLQWWVTFWAPAIGYLARRMRRAQIPFTMVVHNALPHEPRFYDPILTRSALSQVREFIAMNEREEEVLADLVPAGSRILQCPLPVFSVFPDAGMSRKEARQELGLPTARRLVLFFGIVRPYKGLDNLLRALHWIHSRGRHDIDLVIAGEFWIDRKKFTELIRSLDLKDCVHTIDRFVSDLETARLFCAADVFVAPYLAGTQSASIKAALAFGIPMAVTPVVADRMVQGHGEICRVARSAKPRDLARAVLEALELPRLGMRQIARISDASWDEMVECLTGRFEKDGMVRE